MLSQSRGTSLYSFRSDYRPTAKDSPPSVGADVARGECGAAGTGRFRPVSFMTERRRTDAAVAHCADDRNRTRSLRLSAPSVVSHRLSATLMANALSGQLLQVPKTP
jgi:hypothetical protein